MDLPHSRCFIVPLNPLAGVNRAQKRKQGQTKRSPVAYELTKKSVVHGKRRHGLRIKVKLQFKFRYSSGLTAGKVTLVRQAPSPR